MKKFFKLYIERKLCRKIYHIGPKKNKEYNKIMIYKLDAPI